MEQEGGAKGRPHLWETSYGEHHRSARLRIRGNDPFVGGAVHGPRIRGVPPPVAEKVSQRKNRRHLRQRKTAPRKVPRRVPQRERVSARACLPAPIQPGLEHDRRTVGMAQGNCGQQCLLRKSHAFDRSRPNFLP